MDELSGLQQQSQQNLTEFLRTELSLAFTMLEMAGTTRNEPHRVELIAKVKTVIRTVRHFEGKITDREIWRDIHARTDQLEGSLSRSPLNRLAE